jgi:hypothetical protein
MAEQVIQWKAKDGSMHDSEQGADDHDIDRSCYRELVELTNSYTVTEENKSVIADFLMDNKKEIFDILLKRFSIYL